MLLDFVTNFKSDVHFTSNFYKILEACTVTTGLKHLFSLLSIYTLSGFNVTPPPLPISPLSRVAARRQVLTRKVGGY